MNTNLVYRGLATTFTGCLWLAGSVCQAESADRNVEAAIRDAYERGYRAGYQAGYSAGGGTVGQVPKPIATGPKLKGGGSTGKAPLMALELDGETKRWSPSAAAESPPKEPATLNDIKTMSAKEGATNSTIIIENFPVQHLNKLEEAFKDAKKAQLLITPGPGTPPPKGNR